MSATSKQIRALEDAAIKYTGSREGHSRELCACAVELAIALLKETQKMDPLRDKRPAITVLEVYLAGARSK